MCKVAPAVGSYPPLVTHSGVRVSHASRLETLDGRSFHRRASIAQPVDRGREAVVFRVAL